MSANKGPGSIIRARNTIGKTTKRLELLSSWSLNENVVSKALVVMFIYCRHTSTGMPGPPSNQPLDFHWISSKLRKPRPTSRPLFNGSLLFHFSVWFDLGPEPQKEMRVKAINHVIGHPKLYSGLMFDSSFWFFVLFTVSVWWLLWFQL